jgi:hypothetical protein
VEFLGFLLLLICYITWNKRRRRRSALRAHSQTPLTNHVPMPGANQSPLEVAPSRFRLPARATSSTNGVPSSIDGWYFDPTGRYALRYYYNQEWTEWVSSANRKISKDPFVTTIPTPEPGRQVKGPDLNELRRQFNE